MYPLLPSPHISLNILLTENIFELKAEDRLHTAEAELEEAREEINVMRQVCSIFIMHKSNVDLSL